MSRRHEHLESSLLRAIQQVIARGLADPRVSGMISLTEVRVSPDGLEARCRVSVMPHDRERLTLAGLQHSAEHIRRRASDLIEVRRMPRLEFVLDESLKKQAETLEALSKVRAEREAAGLEPDPPTETPADHPESSR